MASGQQIGATCLVCNKGVLHARIETRGGGPRGMQAVIGQSHPTSQHVGDLSCTGCGAVFAAVNAGADVDKLLQAQVDDFQKPDTQPTDCPNCHGGLVAGKTKTFSDTVITSTVQRMRDKDDDTRHHFQYCRGCCLVTWVFPRKIDMEISRVLDTISTRPITRPPRRRR